MDKDKDSIESTARKAPTQFGAPGTRTPSSDRPTTGKGGPYDKPASFSPEPAGSIAKNMTSMGAANSTDAAADKARDDFAALREDLAKLTGTVGQLVQSQAASTGTQVMDAVGVARDKISEGATATQDKLVSLEADLEEKIRQNPLSAVAIALGIGLLLGKMS